MLQMMQEGACSQGKPAGRFFLASLLTVSLSSLCKPWAFCKLSPQHFLQPQTHRTLQSWRECSQKKQPVLRFGCWARLSRDKSKGNVLFSAGPSTDTEENGFCFEINVFDFLPFFQLKSSHSFNSQNQLQGDIFLHHGFLQITILFFH